MKLKCLIADDDRIPRMAIEDLINQTSFLELVASCTNALEAADYIHNHPVDLAFLDIQMPEMTGLELIQSLQKPPLSILITSHEKYGVEACNTNQVVHYIVKPVKPQSFLAAVTKAKHQFEATHQTLDDGLFFFKVDGMLKKVNKAEIKWIGMDAIRKNYQEIHTAKEVFSTRSTMGELSEKLGEEEFIRVHHGFIVRVDQINVINDDVMTIGDKIIPIGRKYKKDLLNRLKV